MNKDNFTFDNHQEGIHCCPVCGGWVSYEEYICNEGICDNCVYDWGDDDE